MWLRHQSFRVLVMLMCGLARKQSSGSSSIDKTVSNKQPSKQSKASHPAPSLCKAVTLNTIGGSTDYPTPSGNQAVTKHDHPTPSGNHMVTKHGHLIPSGHLGGSDSHILPDNKFAQSNPRKSPPRPLHLLVLVFAHFSRFCIFHSRPHGVHIVRSRAILVFLDSPFRDWRKCWRGLF